MRKVRAIFIMVNIMGTKISDTTVYHHSEGKHQKENVPNPILKNHNDVGVHRDTAQQSNTSLLMRIRDVSMIIHVHNCFGNFAPHVCEEALHVAEWSLCKCVCDPLMMAGTVGTPLPSPTSPQRWSGVRKMADTSSPRSRFDLIVPVAGC